MFLRIVRGISDPRARGLRQCGSRFFVNSMRLLATATFFHTPTDPTKSLVSEFFGAAVDFAQRGYVTPPPRNAIFVLY